LPSDIRRGRSFHGQGDGTPAATPLRGGTEEVDAELLCDPEIEYRPTDRGVRERKERISKGVAVPRPTPEHAAEQSPVPLPIPPQISTAPQSRLECPCSRGADTRRPKGPNRRDNGSNRLLRTSRSGGPYLSKRPRGLSSCLPPPSYRRPNGLPRIHPSASLCARATYGGRPWGAERSQADHRVSGERDYAAACIRTSENHPSTHYGG
jgi:hypothetical protein